MGIVVGAWGWGTRRGISVGFVSCNQGNDDSGFSECLVFPPYFLMLLPLTFIIGPSDADRLILSMPEEHEFIWMMLGVLALLIVNTQIFRAKAYQLVDTGSS